MGLLDKLNSGPTRNNQSLVNQTPGLRPGASPSSQLHAQGANTEDANPTTSNQTNATNLKFKTQVGQSKFDLNGRTPDLRAGALSTSQLHAQGVNPTTMKSTHSQRDLDGKLPSTGTYRDNAPEGANF